MDVQVGTVDIHEFKMPSSVKLANVVLVCALVVYIVNTVYRLARERGGGGRPIPLLNGDTEL